MTACIRSRLTPCVTLKIVPKRGEFGGTAKRRDIVTAMDPYNLRALEMTPRLIERELKRLGEAGFDQRPDPERFTPREAISHLVDWEPIMLSRIKVGVDSPGETLQVFDEGQMAADHDYASKDALVEAAKFKSLRAETIRYVGGLTRADFCKKVIHPERGEMSVDDLVHMLVSHDVYHLDHLASLEPGAKIVDTW